MQSNSVFFTSQFNFIACGCQTPGSTSNTCSNNGKCTCNIGYEGDKCSECANEYFMTPAGCSGTIFVMVYLMCLNKQLADFCMFYKILGLACCRLFGNILEITALCSGEHLQMVTSRLHVSPYFICKYLRFRMVNQSFSCINFFATSPSFFHLTPNRFGNFNVKSCVCCRNCLLKKNKNFVF